MKNQLVGVCILTAGIVGLTGCNSNKKQAKMILAKYVERIDKANKNVEGKVDTAAMNEFDKRILANSWRQLPTDALRDKLNSIELSAKEGDEFVEESAIMLASLRKAVAEAQKDDLGLMKSILDAGGIPPRLSHGLGQDTKVINSLNEMITYHNEFISATDDAGEALSKLRKKGSF